jgi:hypothetical protein
MVMFPAVPADALPVAIDILPVFPELEVPVNIPIAPLTPNTPEFCVNSLRTPLELDVDGPAPIRILPPL